MLSCSKWPQSTQDVPPDILEGTLGAQLRADGFDAAAIVMLGGVGAGTNHGFWSRFVMVEGVGVWAMEFMHSLTGFADLYPFNGNMAAFDEMACACGTHPSAYTKTSIGWLDASAIAEHTVPAASYDLYAVGLPQPPPSYRGTAVRFGTQVPYLMVEARQRVDQFDAGIQSEGVIVYRVQTSDPLGWAQNQTAPIELLTTTALIVGQTFTSDNGVTVRVNNVLPGGFSISIEVPTSIVPDVIDLEEIPSSNIHTAAEKVYAAGLVPWFTGDHRGLVKSQKPAANSVVVRRTTVSMRLVNIHPP